VVNAPWSVKALGWLAAVAGGAAYGWKYRTPLTRGSGGLPDRAASSDPTRSSTDTIRGLMAERAAVERELEEIRAQLGWVRDYL
jgi:hypothetical protein